MPPRRGPTGEALMQWLAWQAQAGMPLFRSARALADDLATTTAARDAHARVARLVRRELVRTFTVGFATSVVASLVAPLGVPASVAMAYLLQARLAAAIAALFGHDPADPRVQAKVVQCLLGALPAEGARLMGVQASRWAAGRAAAGTGGRRLAARALARPAKIARLVPVAGAMAGGVADVLACRQVAARATALFAPRR